MTTLSKDQFLVFEMASQQCATPIAEVREILMMAELSQSPGLPRAQAGFLNLGGEAIPVVRLDRLLNLSEGEGAFGLYSHILLTRSKDIEGKSKSRSVGFLTASVKKIIHHPASELLPLSPEMQLHMKDFALGMLPDGKDFLPVLSLQKLLQLFEKNPLQAAS